MRRALVFGGGGVTGVAWELGCSRAVRAGVPVTDADLVVGTSAGSIVGAQVCSGLPVQRFYEEQVAPPSSEMPARLGFAVLARLAWAGGRSRDAVRSRPGSGDGVGGAYPPEACSAR
ncbi:patatin-like phospholipase family protein [Micromonospora sp. M12]